VTTLNGTITDGIGSNDAQLIGYGVGLSETFRLPDLLDIVRARSTSLTDGIGVNDAVIGALGVLVSELIRVHDSQIPNQRAQLTILEKIVTTELISRGLLASAVDGIGIQFVQAAAQLVAVIEKLGLSDLLTPSTHYRLSVIEQLTLAEAIARFIGAGVVEGLQVVETLTGVAAKPGSISDGIGVNDAISPKLLFRAIIDDGLEITDAQLLQTIFSAGIIEGIQLAAAYLAPSGSITTWAMNTRTAAVTEYTNYAFNSFARMGNKYLGATKDGLYELTGDDDAGSSIIADLKSGLAQFDGAHLASFKAAYIAVRGGGSYVLRIYTGDGNRYDYAVTADNMKTARIDMGKGIRARYFAFELISAGQDFDLESLEFVPLIAKRRV
jgi:hypothetical protein